MAPPVSDESDFPKIERWLDEFAKAGLLACSAQGEGSARGQGDSTVCLVDDGARTGSSPDLDPVTDAMARWMARHLHVPQVLGWMLRKGGCLHSRLRELVHRALAQAAPREEIPPRLRHLWTIVADREPTDSLMLRFTSRQLERTSSDSERRRLEERAVESIAPRLVVRPGPSSSLELRRELTQQLGGKSPSSSPVDTCGHLELGSGDVHIRKAHRQILGDEGFLSRNAETLTGYLDRALLLLADVRRSEEADAHSDSSRYRPQIARQKQTRHYDDWTHLIDLVRDSYFALATNDRPRARNLLDRWMLYGQPLFRRLALHALAVDPKSDIRLVRKILLAGRRPGLWEWELRREALQFLELAGSRMPRDLRTEIVRAIHEGPKKSQAGYGKYLRREKTLRFRALDRSGARLDKRSKALAEEGKPAGEDVPEKRDEHAFRNGGTPWMAIEEFAPQDLLEGTVGEVVTALRDKLVDPIGFEGLAQLRPVKAASALRRLARCAVWPVRFWRTFLVSVARLREQGKLRKRLEKYVVHLLVAAPDELFAGVGPSGADFVKCLAEAWSIEREPPLRELWSKAWTGACMAGDADSEDPLADALDHALGRLAEAAFIRLEKYDTVDNEGLPAEVRPYFDTIGAAPRGRLGRFVLAKRLHRLFSIDRGWTRQHLISRLSWVDSEEARDLWTGFAWSPTVGPDLFDAIKAPFLDVLGRYGELGRRGENLVELFITICLDAPREMSADEIDGVVDSLSEEALTVALRSLGIRLDGDSGERARAWDDKVRPWLDRHRPRAEGRNTIHTSEAMVNLVVECGDAFEDAVSWSLSCLNAVEGESLFRLSQSEHPVVHPDATLRLLARVVRDDVILACNKAVLREILDSVRDAMPELNGAPEFQTLYGIATR